MSKDRLIVAEQQSLLIAEQQLVQSCLLVSFISSSVEDLAPTIGVLSYLPSFLT